MNFVKCMSRFIESKLDLFLFNLLVYFIWHTPSWILISQQKGCITFITAALTSTCLHSTAIKAQRPFWWKFDSDIKFIVVGVGESPECWTSHRKKCRMRILLGQETLLLKWGWWWSWWLWQLSPVIRQSLMGAENQWSTRGPRLFSCHTLNTNYIISDLIIIQDMVSQKKTI